MNHDQLALYNKILVLYMLNRVSFPLTQAQIYDFLGANQFKLRNETSVSTDYRKVLSGDYEVHLTVKEKDATVVEITLSVPNKETAEAVCTNWQKKNQDLYQYLAGQLF